MYKRIVILLFLLVFLLFSVQTRASISMPDSPTVLSSRGPSENPVLSDNIYEAVPLGFGPAASNGDSLRLQVGINSFSTPVDLYLFLYVPGITTDFYLLTGDYALQPLSQGITPWKSNIKSSVKETLFDVPLSSLPEGDYQFFLVATTAGMLGASSTGEPGVNSNTNNTGSISKSSAEYYIIWPFMFQNRNTSGSIVMYARIPEGCTLLTDGPDWADLFFYIENGTLIANSFNFIDPDYNGIIHYDWKCWPDDEGYVRMHGEFYISNLKGHLTSNGKDLYYVFNIKEDSQVDYVSYTMGTFYTIPVEDTWTSEWTIPFEDGAILDYGTGVRFIFFLDLDQNR